MEYFVADTYANAERVGAPYKNEKGKLYTKIKYKCPRCGGLGIIASRVENGHIVPIPVAQGICFQCDGAKYITKEVRLYTEKEYNSMKASAERAKERKDQEQKEKMKRDFAANKEKWLADNGFNKNGETYMYFGESYEIKDELKAAGFKFDYLLKWHIAEVPDQYRDKVAMFTVDQLYEISAWGKGVQKEDAQKIVENRVMELNGVEETEWFGNIGDKIDKVRMTLSRKSGFEGRYGYTNIYIFTDKERHKFQWFTATNQTAAVGSEVYVSGTIKSHDEYKGSKTTTLTRCKIKSVD